MDVTKFLADPEAHDLGPLVVLSGSSRFLQRRALAVLRRLVLGEEADELSEARFDGRDVDLATVADELRMVSMWGDRKLVLVDDADEFVTNFRSGLEAYHERPAKNGVLVLVCPGWKKNTRLHKRLAKSGLLLEADELKGGPLLKWLGETAKREHGKPLTRDAAGLLVELVGNEPGLLEQELAKLASYVGGAERIDVEDVRTCVGGWKAETTWAMLDALQDGHVDTALACLRKLLDANEAAPKILGGITFVFRRLATATRLAKQRVPLKQAIRDAGVFRPNDASRAERYLRRVGAARASLILQRLAEADANLKGGSQLPDAVQLERLLIVLAGPVPAKAGR